MSCCRGEKVAMLIERCLTMQFISADPESVLTRLTSAGVELTKIVWVDNLTVEIRIKNRQRALADEVLGKMGTSFCIIKKEGILWLLVKILKRPVLLLNLLVFSFLLVLLPGRVLLIETIGNEVVSEKALLQNLEKNGIYFGVKTSDLRSENIKNMLMEEISELQWVGVTISGCKVTVHVRERSNITNNVAEIHPVSSIIATRDGVISEIIVHCGNPLFQKGESVKTGDVIISGYTDCGIKLVAQRASGEVFAFTHRKCRTITPTAVTTRKNIIGEHSCYRLRIGKKVINLCNHSGISGSTCVKMYSEYYWSLPGGFQLPICFVKIKNVEYDTVSVQETDETTKWLAEYTREYLRSQMVGGSILNESIIWNPNEGFAELMGSYACHEMIGQEKREEIIGQDAKDN